MPSNDIGPKLDVKKEVKYLNKDFAGFRNDLIEFAKTYFPNSYLGIKCFSSENN